MADFCAAEWPVFTPPLTDNLVLEHRPTVLQRLRCVQTNPNHTVLNTTGFSNPLLRRNRLAGDHQKTKCKPKIPMTNCKHIYNPKTSRTAL